MNHALNCAPSNAELERYRESHWHDRQTFMFGDEPKDHDWLGLMTNIQIITNFSIDLEGLRVVPPAPPQTYLGIAHSMIKGARVLADASPPSLLALALIAAHVLECTLKAYLSRNGDDTAVKNDPKVRHNLSALWSMAHDQGLGIPSAMPGWAATLSQGHVFPYFLRYSTGVHGISLPSAEPMVTELQALLSLVQDTAR